MIKVEQRKENARKRRMKMKELGLCSCGKPLGAYKKCDYCIDYVRIKRQKAKENNICCDCHNKKENCLHIRCNNCLEKNKIIQKKIRLEVLTHYGLKCACCGENEIQFLCIDHINNDGKEHRKTVPAGYFYRWLKKNNYPSGFQTLCWNCNMAKSYNNGICPHKLIENSRKEYLETYSKERKVQLKKAGMRYLINLKKEILNNYGNKCVECEEDGFYFLCIDHIDNTGNEHRKEIGNSGLYNWLKNNNFPKDNFQILCWNCNAKKAFDAICLIKEQKNILPRSQT